MPTSGTKEWADKNVNCVRGCKHDCVYCYAKRMAIRFSNTRKIKKTSENWHEMDVDQAIVDKSWRKCKGRVMFPTTHDLVPDDPSFEPCMTVLEKVLAAGNEVLVTTKPHVKAVVRICQDFYQYKDQIQFRFTITSIHADVLKKWEPGAPSFEERLEALEWAFHAGYKTSISCEPALDEIEDIQRLYDFVMPYVTESFWIGRMNHMTGPATWTSHEIFQAFDGKPLVRFKDSIRNEIGMVEKQPALPKGQTRLEV
jgi:DNA repair photolyase